MPMNCDQATELLPWLLNGSLDQDERRRVVEHLAQCAGCRTALAETRLAWQLYAGHPPTAALVAHAYGEAEPGIGPDLLADHLASCPQCAAESELAQASRRLEEAEEVAAAGGRGRIAFLPRRRPAAPPQREPLGVPAAAAAFGHAGRVAREGSAGGWGWRGAALAAGLAGLVALTGWTLAALRVRSLEGDLAARRQPPPAAAAPAPRPLASPPPGAANPERRPAGAIDRERAAGAATHPERAAGAAFGELARLQERELAARQRLAALEGDNRKLQRSVTELSRQAAAAGERIASLGRARGGAPTPATPLLHSNTWVRDVSPAEEVVRGAAAEPLVVPADAPAATLMLGNPHHRESYPAYEIEIRDARGTRVWDDTKARPDPDAHDFAITLERGALAKGDYQIRVFGLPAGRGREPRTLLGSYSIRVS
ncbi:MAG TPA: zf-HC2 domain-containing protein [Thermoanaerobaculia bacterium]|nr:zf-HC2 domain-containing protein [Thermoanaerobaculia bacterium]